MTLFYRAESALQGHINPEIAEIAVLLCNLEVTEDFIFDAKTKLEKAPKPIETDPNQPLQKKIIDTVAFLEFARTRIFELRSEFYYHLQNEQEQYFIPRYKTYED